MENEVNIREQAIEFVMEFYKVERDVAITLYKDEVEAYVNLFEFTQLNAR
jgi:hypothetical protein